MAVHDSGSEEYEVWICTFRPEPSGRRGRGYGRVPPVTFQTVPTTYTLATGRGGAPVGELGGAPGKTTLEAKAKLRNETEELQPGNDPHKLYFCP